MSVMNQEIATGSDSRIVVHAAGTISHVSHDHTLDAGKPGKNVRNGTSIHEQTFGHLKSYTRSFGGFNGVKRFVNLKVVVFGE